MKRWHIYYCLIILSIITLLTACSGSGRNTSRASGQESISDSSGKPYLILISLDGFRWDYVDRFKPPHLTRFIKNGVKAESLIPAFPSKTFPNHYTIATGMYPDKHGILGNAFYSYKKGTTYTMNNRTMVEDGSYYGGSPIWVQAGKAGIVTASYFFAGSEADIQGYRPDYYFNYDGKVKNDIRVAQAIKWLQLPEKERPHLITLYFSDMDDMGHRYGPNADSVLQKTLLELDLTLGSLFNQIEQSGIPVNIIIVSDHGMMEIPNDQYLSVDQVQDSNRYLAINSGALVSIHPKDPAATEEIFKALRKKEVHFKVYKTENTPGFERVPTNKDWGAIQVIPETGFYFTEARSIAAMAKSPQKVSGVHGYDPKIKEMQGIFYANGPAFKKGYSIPSFKNIHIYPLMCKILELQIPGNIDGKLSEVEEVLRKVKN